MRGKGGDCVVHEYPEDAEVLERWTSATGASARPPARSSPRS